MDWIEVTAKTVDDARELALDRLGVVEDELEYEVIDEPRGGFFGRLTRADARIRARVKPLSREKPTDRRRRRGRGGNGSSHSRRSEGNRSESNRAEGNNAEGSRSSSSASPPRVPGGNQGRGEASSPSGGARKRRRRGGAGRGPRSGTNGAGGAVDSGAERGERAQAGTEKVVDTEAMSVEEQAQRATAFAAGLVEAMGFDARVEADIDEDDVMVRIEGDGLGVLVGPKGATLHAIEELVRAVIQHTSAGHSARVRVDVAGYRERRRTALAAFAEQVAAEVRETGAERALEPMTPPDRKVVHDALSEVEGVTTGSEGEEPRRRVVIRPA